jgi:hypothetical protein
MIIAKVTNIRNESAALPSLMAPATAPLFASPLTDMRAASLGRPRRPALPATLMTIRPDARLL